MEFDYNNVKLDRDDLDSLSGTIGDALDKWGSTDEELLYCWKTLPNDIKIDAIKYGIVDTPTRESIYVWLLQNKKNLFSKL